MDQFLTVAAQAVGIALAGVGVLEWLKGRLPALPASVFGWAAPVVYLGVGAAQALAPWAYLGLLALSLGQIAYGGLIELPRALIDKARGR